VDPVWGFLLLLDFPVDKRLNDGPQKFLRDDINEVCAGSVSACCEFPVVTTGSCAAGAVPDLF
jgi:hypothetical protein